MLMLLVLALALFNNEQFINLIKQSRLRAGRPDCWRTDSQSVNQSISLNHGKENRKNTHCR